MSPARKAAETVPYQGGVTRTYEAAGLAAASSILVVWGLTAGLSIDVPVTVASAITTVFSVLGGFIKAKLDG